MSYHIDNLGLGLKRIDQIAKAIEKYLDAGLKPAPYELPVQCYRYYLCRLLPVQVRVLRLDISQLSLLCVRLSGASG